MPAPRRPLPFPEICSPLSSAGAIMSGIWITECVPAPSSHPLEDQFPPPALVGYAPRPAQEGETALQTNCSASWEDGEVNPELTFNHVT